MKTNHFLNMIAKLRQHEEVMLYGHLLQVQVEDSMEVQVFLKEEYERESVDYPYTIPAFDPAGALWAAKTVYFAAQLMLYRRHEEKELDQILSDFPGVINPAAMLSADLCLRFVPHMITQLKLIDPEDALIEVLERQLRQWHYSGVNYALEIDQLDLSLISRDPCLHQLYCNRIITYKNLTLALNLNFKERIKANLGIYASEFWDDFKLETESNTRTHE